MQSSVHKEPYVYVIPLMQNPGYSNSEHLYFVEIYKGEKFVRMKSYYNLCASG